MTIPEDFVNKLTGKTFSTILADPPLAIPK